jgi:putative colanic acid biosynthesis UDP-glucose lipid carrier transferase
MTQGRAAAPAPARSIAHVDPMRAGREAAGPGAPLTPVMFRRSGRLSVGRDHLLNLIEMFLDPLALVLSLWAIAFAVEGHLRAPHIILALVVFSLTFPGPAALTQSLFRAIRNIGMGWLTLAALLFVFGYASGYIAYFHSDTLTTWLWVAPASQAGAQVVLRLAAPRIRELQGGTRKAIVAGMNETGLELARRLDADVYSSVRIVGFADDRAPERIGAGERPAPLGRIEDLPELVKKHQVELVYLALPMVSQPRIVALLDALRDTTASVYFVPDMFVTYLIQGQIDSVNGMPVVGVCDTPFFGTNGLVKRVTDVVLSAVILALAAPLMLALAAAVKLTSPGPVIFRQRRYGLDGHEIIVYKFRTMTVTEDGSDVRQASRDDRRITPLGAFMRRTSLDELPQFFNVLQGRMSIVGPRPHAVAHNEMYRKLIKGYMQRHKVKPGITGWAQVHGFRGETETLQKMKARIDYDLEYLRNWSVRLDLYIIAKTAWVVLKGSNAY